ncbi:MAG TPA: hypothetical protein VF168_08275 [Trueperaceae bacterium]
MSDWDRYSTEHDVSGSIYESDYGRSSEGLRDRARQGVDQMRHRAQDMSGKAREGFDHYFHQHPLTFGIGAVALGFAIGMLLPATRPEERWMGEASERVKERGRETMHKVGDVARTSFEEARETARHEMEERGLDPKKMAHEARDVAEKTAKEARRAAEEEAERNKLR